MVDRFRSLDRAGGAGHGERLWWIGLVPWTGRGGAGNGDMISFPARAGGEDTVMVDSFRSLDRSGERVMVT